MLITDIFTKEELNKSTTVTEFMATFCDHYSISVGDLVGDRKFKRLVDLRSIAVKILYDKFDLSYPEIAGLMNRTHPNIMHLYKRPVGKLFRNHNKTVDE